MKWVLGTPECGMSHSWNESWAHMKWVRRVHLCAMRYRVSCRPFSAKELYDEWLFSTKEKKSSMMSGFFPQKKELYDEWLFCKSACEKPLIIELFGGKKPLIIELFLLREKATHHKALFFFCGKKPLIIELFCRKWPATLGIIWVCDTLTSCHRDELGIKSCHWEH